MLAYFVMIYSQFELLELANRERAVYNLTRRDIISG